MHHNFKRTSSEYDFGLLNLEVGTQKRSLQWLWGQENGSVDETKVGFRSSIGNDILKKEPLSNQSFWRESHFLRFRAYG